MLEKYQLPNGLKVILYPSGKSPVVTVQAWVRTGSADENKGEEGISHFIEHLLFKGTRRYKVGEIASIVEGSGGELNAYTSFDQTVFHVTISKEFTDTALDTLSEMMGFPSFDAQEIDNEREVVIEEIKRTNDNPHRAASRLLFSGIYQKHPYGKPVIGFEKNIQNFTRKEILNYFHSRYSPRNMFLVVAGDFEKAGLKKGILEKFGAIKTYKVRDSHRPKEPKQKSPQVFTETVSFQESILHIGWRIPGAKHKDTPALDILALIFGQGDSSRLAKRVRFSQPLVNYVGAHVYSPSDEGFFGVTAGLTATNLEEYLTCLGEEILNLRQGSVTHQELAKALSIMEADEFYGIETVDGIARKVGSFEHLFKQPEYYQKYLKLLLKVNASDIQDVARRYLVPETMTLAGTIVGDEPEAQRALARFAGNFDFAIKALKNQKPERSHHKIKAGLEWSPRSAGHSKVAKEKLVGGGRAFFLANHQAPTVSLRVAFRGGQRTEKPGKEGLSDFLANTWLAGTKSLTEEALLQNLEENAISIRPFSGRNTVGLSLTCLAPHLEEAAGLFFDVMTNPKFHEESVERERVIMLEGLKQKLDNPAMVSIQNFQSIIFKGHPYAMEAQGTPESIKQIRAEDIRSAWQHMVCKANLTLVGVGDYKPGQISQMVNFGISGLKVGAPINDRFELQAVERDQDHFQELKKEQSHIVYGMRGLSLYDSRRVTLQVLQSILAGQGGRLFLELRDKASLAYSVAPVQTDGIEAGYFGAYIGCSPEKGAKALEMMDVEFRKLAESQVGDAELERAKRYLIGRHDIGLQKNSSVASAILFEEVYDLPHEAVFEYANQIRRVTSEDVRALAETLYKEKKIRTAVGPVCPW